MPAAAATPALPERFLRHRFKAMGTLCELRLLPPPGEDGDTLARALASEVLRLEGRYSRYRGDSLLSLLNASAGDPAGIEVDDECAALLDYAATCHEQSGGLFDLTSGVLRELWDFKSKAPAAVPSPERVRECLARVGWRRLRWRRPRLFLPAGMALDLGGLVKEYAADRAAVLARELGARHGLVDLGGDIAIIGPRPGGAPWRLGVRDPMAPQWAVADIQLSAGALATSGDYERYLEIGGKRYGHILNPLSGWPVQGLATVSVAADSCLVAGSAATIAMLMGREGPAWLAGLGLPHLWVDAERRRGGTIAAG